VSNVTDPQSGQIVTIPSVTPVVGATQAWFGGRVYAPNAIVTSSSTVSVVFSGYDKRLLAMRCFEGSDQLTNAQSDR